MRFESASSLVRDLNSRRLCRFLVRTLYMRNHEPDFVIGDLLRKRIFDRAQALDAQPFARVFNLNTLWLGHPVLLKLQPAFLDQIGDQAGDGRQLALTKPRNLFERFTLRQQLNRLLSWTRHFLRLTCRSCPAAKFVDGVNQLRSVGLCFDRTEARHAPQLFERTRLLTTEFFERGVMHDYECGEALFLSRGTAPLPQVLAKVWVYDFVQSRADCVWLTR